MNCNIAKYRHVQLQAVRKNQKPPKRTETKEKEKKRDKKMQKRAKKK